MDVAGILKERARRLAEKSYDDAVSSETIEVIEFSLAHERYALEAVYVKEVFGIREVTTLPHTPPFVVGITARQGRIISVIDMKKFFDLPEKGITDLSKIIIISNSDMEIGLLASEIQTVRLIPRNGIDPPLPTLTGIHSDFLRGVTKDRLIILDAMRILSDKRIIVHDEV